MVIQRLWVWGLLLLTLLATKTFATQRPNLVFIIADDCTYRDIGCYGGQAYTPHIDALAQQGMKFNRCFQTAPMCSPTRHSLYTGLYPVKSGAYANHTFTYDHVKSIVHYLKPLGYRVALSGKVHVAPESVFSFEYSKNKTKLESVIDMHAVDTLMAECVETDTPFTLFACSGEPHGPWNKGKEYRSRYDAKTLRLRPYMVDTPETRQSYVHYLAEISFFDSEVGQMLGMLKQHKLEENTLVIVVSEQGNHFPFAKWTCYDSGLQSIMIARWPGKITPGSETNAMVEYIDVCPTFVAAAGGTPDPILDGKSLLPILFGKTHQHKTHVFGLQTSRGIYNGSHHYPIRSVRDENYKLILNLDPEARFKNYVVNYGWFKSWQQLAETGDNHARSMVQRHFQRPAIELYDIVKDPYEMKNLAEDPQYTQVIKDMKKTLDNWMAAQGDKGLETELKAFERMLSGNAEYQAWAKKHRTAKKPKNY